MKVIDLMNALRNVDPETEVLCVVDNEDVGISGVIIDPRTKEACLVGEDEELDMDLINIFEAQFYGHFNFRAGPANDASPDDEDDDSEWGEEDEAIEGEATEVEGDKSVESIG